MVDNVPNWIDFLFILTSIATIIMFYYSNGKAKRMTTLITFWSIGHLILAYFGFYQDTKSTPPRFALVLIPSILLIICGMLPKGRKWILENRDSKLSTFLHSVRLPVEIVLHQLFIYKMIPELMTYEGRNFDIIMGISAPIIGLLLLRGKIGRVHLITWNIIGLVMILFILFVGITSAELPFQLFGFEQPNRAVIYVPYVLLPATIVPIVIWTHVTDIYKLMVTKKG